MIRPTRPQDIDSLLAIENRCFDSDRLSRRQFRYLLTRAHSLTLVDERQGRLCGYVMVLFDAGTSLARLYSIAVSPDFRKRGIGSSLIAAAEDAARERDCISMRLEIRKDNASSIRAFERAGYRQFAVYRDYYQDHTEALRYEKRLVARIRPEFTLVPYYHQTLKFTCGSAALMMALKALQSDLKLDRHLEIDIWRESTTVFMTSGHGGTSPYGLALAAYRRSFDVEVFVHKDATLFVDSVRSKEKKEIIRLVEINFMNQIDGLGLTVHHRRISSSELRLAFESGGIPIVLISSYRIYKEKSPHWVVVTGFDEKFIYVHDPYVDRETGKTMTDSMSMPILQKDFERMVRYGKSGQRAALIVRRRKQSVDSRYGNRNAAGSDSDKTIDHT